MKRGKNRILVLAMTLTVLALFFVAAARRSARAVASAEPQEPAAPEIEELRPHDRPEILPELLSAPEEPAEPEEPAPESRYTGISMTDAERDLMATVIYLEAGNQCAEGQQAVAEVILNRVLNSGWPDTVYDVLWQENQFEVMPMLSTASPTQAQYDAIDAALYGENILPPDVVFFARGPENDRVWGWIGGHCFCYEYIWG